MPASERDKYLHPTGDISSGDTTGTVACVVCIAATASMNSLAICRSSLVGLGDVALMFAVVAASPALCAAGNANTGTYQLQPTVVGAGGVRMQGTGGWSLVDTVGEADVIVQNGTGGLCLDGGFWRTAGNAVVISDRIFASGFKLAPGNKAGALGKP